MSVNHACLFDYLYMRTRTKKAKLTLHFPPPEMPFFPFSSTSHPSPDYPHLMHIFTMLVSWKQIESILLPNIRKARNEISFAKKVPRDHLNDVTSKDAKPAKTSDNVYEQPDAYNVIRDVTFRLDLPIHKCTTEQSTLNTLKYLFFHMKCGIYVMIRNGDVR